MAKYAQNDLRMHLLQSRISKFSGRQPLYPPSLPERGVKPRDDPSQALPHLHLQHTVRASGTQLSPYFIN
jgi:hypothetical protein